LNDASAAIGRADAAGEGQGEWQIGCFVRHQALPINQKGLTSSTPQVIPLGFVLIITQFHKCLHAPAVRILHTVFRKRDYPYISNRLISCIVQKDYWLI